jgi:hypothetical protein
VRAGLAAVPGEADVILVHDAARPLAPIGLFEAVVAAVVAAPQCDLRGPSGCWGVGGGSAASESETVHRVASCSAGWCSTASGGSRGTRTAT